MSQTKKVLVVDDELQIRKTLGVISKKIVNHVDYAEDGIEALQKAVGGEFDLILLDIRMPRLSGLGFIQIMKQHFPEEMAHKKIIVITACIEHESSEDQHKIYQYLENNTLLVLKKPFSVQEVLEQVKKSLE